MGRWEKPCSLRPHPPTPYLSLVPTVTNPPHLGAKLERMDIEKYAQLDLTTQEGTTEALQELLNLKNDVDALSGRFPDNEFPKLDILDTGDAYRVYVDLPSSRSGQSGSGSARLESHHCWHP